MRHRSGLDRPPCIPPGLFGVGSVISSGSARMVYPIMSPVIDRILAADRSGGSGAHQEIYSTSLEVAAYCRKAHKHVLEAIRNRNGSQAFRSGCGIAFRSGWK